MTRHGPSRAEVVRCVLAGLSTRRASLLRRALSALLVGLLAACGATPHLATIPVTEEAAGYRSHARTYYAPPGPPGDPWGPYIVEASGRFDVPQTWIRAVMQQESGGHEFINGQFVTSVPGAMGLMQLMPPTYDEMRAQYGLSADPFDPHDNILAGTAYLRQMYDIYGAPGFLAAYNTGPGRLDDFLTRNRALPHETRQYVAIIGPQIAGVYPSSRSRADLMVMNRQTGAGRYAAVPTQSPAETRSVQTAWARRREHDAGPDQPVEVAEAPPAAAVSGWRAPSRSALATMPVAGDAVRTVWASRLAARPATVAVRVQLARAQPVARVQPDAGVQPGAGGRATAPGFRLIETAMAARAPAGRAGAIVARDWAIQVGAFGTAGQASQAAVAARSRVVRSVVGSARTEIAGVRSSAGLPIYRARLTGFSRADAVEACQRLTQGRSACMVVSPDSRS